MINNRQNGRRRGRGGQQARNGQPGGPDRGNRLDNRARGNAAQLLEKYKTLARDAQMQGDRVNTEYYLQFADHYFRVLSESRSRFEEQQQRRPRDEFADEDGNQQRGYQGDDNGDDGWDDVDNIDMQSDYRQPEPRQPEPRQSEPRQQDSRQQDARQSDSRRQQEPRQQEPRQAEPRQAEPRQPEARAEQPQRPLRARREDRAPYPVETEGEPVQREPRRNGESPRSRAKPSNGHERTPEVAADTAPARIEIDLPPSISGNNDAPPADNGAEAEAAPKRRRTRRPRAEGAPAEA